LEKFPLQKQVRMFLEENLQLTLDNDGPPDTSAEDFARLAIKADCAGGVVDFDEAFIETSTPDDSYVYQGPTQLISNPLVLDNGDQISVSFGTTDSDNINANQLVSVDLVNAIKFAIESANINLSSSEKIISIYNGNYKWKT